MSASAVKMGYSLSLLDTSTHLTRCPGTVEKRHGKLTQYTTLHNARSSRAKSEAPLLVTMWAKLRTKSELNRP